MNIRVADIDELSAFIQARQPSLQSMRPVRPARTPALHAPVFVSVEDKQFFAMQTAYARTGGLVHGDEVACRLRRHSEQPVSAVARWIVSRAIVNFQWRSQTFIPLFQFSPADMSLRCGLTEAVQELAAVFDDWELAQWFAQPNTWLHDQAPACAMAGDPTEVLHAARADRFIARG